MFIITLDMYYFVYLIHIVYSKLKTNKTAHLLNILTELEYLKRDNL